MFKTNHYKIFSVIFVFLSFFSFFVGFYLDENSAGGGNYTGDFSLIWKNLQLFINNDILTAINYENYSDVFVFFCKQLQMPLFLIDFYTTRFDYVKSAK